MKKRLLLILLIFSLSILSLTAQTTTLLSGLNNPRGLAINGNDLYIVEIAGNKIIKIDLSQSNPIPVDVVVNLDSPREIVFNGNDLYITENSRISRVNVTTPLPATRQDFFNGVSFPQGMFTHNNYLYSVSGAPGNVIRFDMTSSTPAAELVINGSTAGFTGVNDFVKVGNDVFIGDNSKISRFDVTQNSPAVQDVITTNIFPDIIGPNIGLTEYDGYVYIAKSNTGSVLRFESSNPTNTITTLLNTNDILTDVQAHNGELYITDISTDKVVKYQLPQFCAPQSFTNFNTTTSGNLTGLQTDFVAATSECWDFSARMSGDLTINLAAGGGSETGLLGDQQVNITRSGGETNALDSASFTSNNGEPFKLNSVHLRSNHNPNGGAMNLEIRGYNNGNFVSGTTYNAVATLNNVMNNNWVEFNVSNNPAFNTIDQVKIFQTGTAEWAAVSIDEINITSAVENNTSSTSNVTSCDSFVWNGVTYTTSGIYTWIGTNSIGFDSTAILNLTINNSTSSSSNVTACNSYDWNGTTYTASGLYFWTGTNSVGCDSTAMLDLTIDNSTSSSSDVTACDSYNWHGTTYTTSGIYTWTGTNAFGCDSIATLDLTINNSTTSTTNITACDTFTWNGATYTTSGIYTWTGTNAIGCDSIATLNLTINNSTTSTTNIIACDTFTWNGMLYNSSGVYTWTGANVLGCDSVATLNLTINYNTFNSLVTTACDSFTWYGTTYTTSGTYNWAGINAAGCDSTALLILTITNSTNSITDTTVCESFTWNGTTYTTSGTYTWNGTNSTGCDSIATLNLIVNNSYSSSISAIACNSYTWNGTTYTTSGTYTWSGTTTSGCDSSAVLVLTIDTISDLTTSVNGVTITANNANAMYQWVDCDDNYAPIDGEDIQTFTPSENGSYAVIITEGNCSDTSDCVIIDKVSIQNNYLNANIKVYPNPTREKVTVDLGGLMQNITLTVLNMQGKIVQTLHVTSEQLVTFSLDTTPGIYFIDIEIGEAIVRRKITKK